MTSNHVRKGCLFCGAVLAIDQRTPDPKLNGQNTTINDLKDNWSFSDQEHRKQKTWKKSLKRSHAACKVQIRNGVLANDTATFKPECLRQLPTDAPERSRYA